VDPQGHVASTMTFAGYPDNMVRSAVPTSTLKVLANIDRANTEVFTLNDKFAQIASPRPTKLKMTINGCAWVLWDGSGRIRQSLRTGRRLPINRRSRRGGGPTG
jgi:hypothetical protein